MSDKQETKIPEIEKGRMKMDDTQEAKLPEIEKVRTAVVDFLKRTLNVKDAKVIKLGKVGDGWEAAAEVYEESSFIKALGLATRVQDRNIYSVKVNSNLEVESYEREGQLRLNE